MTGEAEVTGKGPSPRVGVGVIVTRGNQVLLLKRANAHGSGTWSTPGGHLEFGESFAECAIREALEETGVVLKNIRFKGITNDVFDQEGKHYLTVWMAAEYAAGEVRVNAEYEMTEVAWFDWGNLPTSLFLPFQNLLDGKIDAVLES